MKYRLRTYRDAYLAAIDGKSEREASAITKRFLSLLVAARDFSRVHRIVKEIRREYVRRLGSREVLIESAAPLSQEHRRDLQRALGRGARIQEVTDPHLLAGVRITIDDEVLIDATGKGILDTLFSQKSYG